MLGGWLRTEVIIFSSSGSLAVLRLEMQGSLHGCSPWKNTAVP